MRQFAAFSGRARRAVALFISCALLTACGAEGLAVGNLTRKDGGISFRFANDSADTGDVVLWIEQDNVTSCERILRVEANHTYDVTIGCSMTVRPFYLRFAWASAMRERALVAQRVR